MYVIVDIAGQQYKVEKDQKIYVNRLEGEAGSKIDFDKVLLVEDNGKVQIGMPLVKNMVVSASIVSHVKGDKVKVFKKKRRKGYQVLNGHRQSMTQILIEGIGEGQAKARPAVKKETKPKAQAVPVVDKGTDTEVDKKSETAKEVKTVVEKVEKTAKPKTKEKPATEQKKTEAKKAKPATGKKVTGTTAKKPATKKAAPKTKKETKKDSEE